MADELRWPGAHPMYLDISLDQLSFLRPTRRLAGHTVPGVDRLFTCGASTAPVGGIAGSSGRPRRSKHWWRFPRPHATSS